MKKLGSFLTGLALSVALTVILVLVFALIVKWFSLTSVVISPVNRIIKVIGILIAVLFAVRERGFIFGAIMGTAYIFLTTVLFGALSGGVNFQLSFVWEVIFGLLIGALCGIISSNLKRRGA